MARTRQSLIRLLPAAGATLAGVSVAALFLLAPPEMLEDWVWSSGVAALVPAAAPPLGTTARVVLALAGGLLAAVVAWSALFLIWGPGGFLAPKAAASDGIPTVRRADAHPDAPPRRPLSAADLGVPPPPPERTLPADLDQPLAAFDPAAILPVPMAPIRPVAPLAVPADIVVPDLQPTPLPPSPPPPSLPKPAPMPADRIETFELTPMVRQPAPRAEPEPPATIETLLRRLEQGSVRRPGRIPPR